MRWAVLITIILFIIPFFWLKPGEMDLGGDGSRLYYYDPLGYLQNDGLFLFDNVIEGIRTIEPHFYNIPFVFLLASLKAIFFSSYIVISIINGLKLSLSFLFIFLIVKTLLEGSFKSKKNIYISFASILGGIFYITTPSLIGNYDKALITQNQVFLNPLIFYLLLTSLLREKFIYIVIAVIVSVLFAPNFAWAAAPPFFAFYPLALLFLLIYIYFIQKKKIIFKHIFWGMILFFGLHAFHIIPEIYSLLSPGSYVHTRVFSEDNIKQQLNYFYGVLPLSKLSFNILSYTTLKDFVLFAVIPILFILFGLLYNKAKDRILLLTGVFFLITLYLLTANITSLGVKIYESFFYIPGFSMFRNFIGQWAFVFTFFYALLFGQSIYLIFKKLNSFKINLLITLTIIFGFIISNWSFFNGSLTNKTHSQTQDVKIAMKLDPAYVNIIERINKIDDKGAIISFPFTDCCYSVIHGINDGAYVGTSPITFLTGKKDYNGYIRISPFGGVFLELSKAKDYESLKKLLGILNIQYIYYNYDTKIYDKTFIGYPYGTVRTYLPNSQKEYKAFISKIGAKKVYEIGTYQLINTDVRYTNETIYTPNVVHNYKDSKDEWYGKTVSFFKDKPVKDNAFIEEKNCIITFSKNDCAKSTIKFEHNPSIYFEKINHTKFKVHIKNVRESYMLILSETFHPNWNLYIQNENKTNFINELLLQKKIEERQTMVNGYANGWLIEPGDVNSSDYVLIVEMSEQRIFYLGLVISLATAIIITFLWGGRLFRK